MNDTSLDGSKEQRARFLAMYRADLEGDALRTLHEYLACFPGHEAAIAEEWACLEPESAVDVGVLERPEFDRGESNALEELPPSVGPYRILRRLGHGAQATVYLAEHSTLRRRVALKVLAASSPGEVCSHVARFRREAELTAQLDHPGICRVLEADIEHSPPWIAMQLVRGETLASLLSKRSADAKSLLFATDSASDSTDAHSQTKRIGGQTGALLLFFESVARALHVAHQTSLVHRDIKPGNLMVCRNGQPVILDFGLARFADDVGHGLTRSDDILGTPYYLAPEQLRNETVDARTDVFALGVTMYECFTGRRPFEAASRDALYHQILHEDPVAPRTLHPQLPRDVAPILIKALAKARAQRYPSALQLAEDLQRARFLQPIQARPISAWGRVARWARRNPLVATSVTLTVGALTAALLVSLASVQRTSLALIDRTQAVVALQQRVDQLYGVFSVWDATAINRGEALLPNSGQTALTIDILERIQPGVHARVMALAANITESIDSTATCRAICSMLAGLYREDLLPAQRLCVADNLSAKLLELRIHARLHCSPQEFTELLEWSRLAVRIRRQPDQPASPTDLRYLTTCCVHMDYLLAAGAHEAAATEAQRCLAEIEEQHYFARRYQWRLARAQIRAGAIEQAATLLAAVDARTIRRDGTPAQIDRSVAWIELHDAQKDTSAASRERAALATSLAELGWSGGVYGRLLFADRPLIWPALTSLWDAVTSRTNDLLVPLAKLEAAMNGAGIVMPGPEAAYLAYWTASFSDVVQDRNQIQASIALAQTALKWTELPPDRPPFAVYPYAVQSLCIAWVSDNQVALAEPVLRRALANDDGTRNPAFDVRECMRVQLGCCLLRIGSEHDEEAEATLLAAIGGILASNPEIGPVDANLHYAAYHLLELYARTGRLKVGAALARERLEVPTGLTPYWRNTLSWGIVRSPDQGVADYLAAREAIHSAVADEPTRWRFHQTLGLAEYRLGNLEAALAALRVCQDLCKQQGLTRSCTAAAIVALAHAGSGETQQARQAFATAKGMLPTTLASINDYDAAALLAEGERIGLHQ